MCPWMVKSQDRIRQQLSQAQTVSQAGVRTDLGNSSYVKGSAEKAEHKQYLKCAYFKGITETWKEFVLRKRNSFHLGRNLDV